MAVQDFDPDLLETGIEVTGIILSNNNPRINFKVSLFYDGDLIDSDTASATVNSTSGVIAGASQDVQLETWSFNDGSEVELLRISNLVQQLPTVEHYPQITDTSDADLFVLGLEINTIGTPPNERQISRTYWRRIDELEHSHGYSVDLSKSNDDINVSLAMGTHVRIDPNNDSDSVNFDHANEAHSSAFATTSELNTHAGTANVHHTPPDTSDFADDNHTHTTTVDTSVNQQDVTITVNGESDTFTSPGLLVLPTHAHSTNTNGGQISHDNLDDVDSDSHHTQAVDSNTEREYSFRVDGGQLQTRYRVRNEIAGTNGTWSTWMNITAIDHITDTDTDTTYTIMYDEATREIELIGSDGNTSEITLPESEDVPVYTLTKNEKGVIILESDAQVAGAIKLNHIDIGSARPTDHRY